MKDQDRERRIRAAHHRLLRACAEPEQRTAFGSMARLCRGRSARQVARMEHARGLR